MAAAAGAATAVTVGAAVARAAAARAVAIVRATARYMALPFLTVSDWGPEARPDGGEWGIARVTYG
ncbi:hypothetical protein GCM10010195_47010 [Kitasatospora griseola]|nr:hypothetical protein GCM10010195_47010 [Kitasatospora griseola]